MNFSDSWATDEDGNQFVFTVEMKRRLQDAGLPIEPEYLSQVADAAPASAPARRDDRDQRSSSSSNRREESTPEPAEIQIDPETGKYIGRLKWYNSQRGYGFIARGGGEDIFFHKSDVNANLDDFVDGSWVLYDVEETAKGLEANEIELYDGPPSA